MGETTWQTNMASEYYVLSALIRKGIDASLTLGNKKAVDILIVRPDGKTITIDVKGLAGKHDWILGDSPLSENPNHYYALLTFEGKMKDLTQVPRVWIIPTEKIAEYVTTSGNGKTKYVPRKTIREQAEEFEEAWDVFKPE